MSLDHEEAPSHHSVLPEKDSFDAAWFLERSKYIPVRLTHNERARLRLLESALHVSEYTDKVDVLASTGKRHNKIHKQLIDICSILSGLVVAADYKQGQALIENREFSQFAWWFKEVFEVGRRYKCMNPEKMRATYGKLIYLLQDSQIPDIAQLLEFSAVAPMKTVYSTLKDNGCEALLSDPLLADATMEVLAGEGVSRREIDARIKTKERAIEALARRYANDGQPEDKPSRFYSYGFYGKDIKGDKEEELEAPRPMAAEAEAAAGASGAAAPPPKAPGLSSERIRQCLYSIGDNHAFLTGNRLPVDKMLGLLTKYFEPESPSDPTRSLAIEAGREGARLTHGHSTQYAYALQSLSLWREILHDMFRLWNLAEQDLLDPRSPYSLRDTGQGLNRVQACPRVGRAMQQILDRTMRRVGSWVGSAVVHLGDANVPNALVFLDKYSQVTRILSPIVRCIEEIPAIHAKTPALRAYIDSFGGVEALRILILRDFFRHGFDGSGADSYFSAGSCIDGRLTSAWNWTSLIEKKSYFNVFLLSGFMGFDGAFNN